MWTMVTYLPKVNKDIFILRTIDLNEMHFKDKS